MADTGTSRSIGETMSRLYEQKFLGWASYRIVRGVAFYGAGRFRDVLALLKSGAEPERALHLLRARAAGFANRNFGGRSAAGLDLMACVGRRPRRRPRTLGAAAKGGLAVRRGQWGGCGGSSRHTLAHLLAVSEQGMVPVDYVLNQMGTRSS